MIFLCHDVFNITRANWHGIDLQFSVKDFVSHYTHYVRYVGHKRHYFIVTQIWSKQVMHWITSLHFDFSPNFHPNCPWWWWWRWFNERTVQLRTFSRVPSPTGPQPVRGDSGVCMCIHVCLVWSIFPTAFIVPHHLPVCWQLHTDNPSGRGVPNCLY